MNGRIVITGAGVVSPVGCGLDDVFAALEKGIPGSGHIRNFAAEVYPSRLGAEVKDSGEVSMLPSHVDRKEIFLAKAMGQLSTGAAFQFSKPHERLFHLGAGIDYFDLPGYAESDSAEAGNWQAYSRNTLTMTRELAHRYEIAGDITVNVTACVASSQALGLSFRRLRRMKPGTLAISGGVDSMLNPLHYMGFHKLGALSDWNGDPALACRPFDKNRRGLVLGEGAALFTLQQASSAQPESVLAEIAGYASTMDAYMATDPDPSGAALARAALNAMAEAGVGSDGIDCVHLHGTGTQKNEPAEAAAMRLIFSERYRDIPVFSMKGQVGHLIAGCGAMEMVGVLYSLQTQSVPPTVNFSEPDPDVPLRVISGEPLKMKIRTILKLNAAFGGQNTALVVKRYEP
jgi:3-oxoacyl-[acyl-carrier-protein] synthase II